MIDYASKVSVSVILPETAFGDKADGDARLRDGLDGSGGDDDFDDDELSSSSRN